MNRFLQFLAICFGFALAASSGAQQPGPKPEASAANFQLMALMTSPVLADLHYMRGPDDGVPVSVPMGRLSQETYAAPSAGPLVFAVRRTDPQGKVAFIPISQTPWPVGVDKAIVFVAATGSGAGTKVQAMVVDNSLKAFPARSMRVMNFSGRPLLGQFGDVRSEIGPGPGRPVAYPDVKIPEGGSVGRFPVALGISSEQGPPKVLFKGFTEAWPRARTLIVVTPPVGENSIRPQVRFVLDVLPPEKKGTDRRVAAASGY